MPAHEGVKGDEVADRLAKGVQISFGIDVGKATIKKKGVEIWQKRWEEGQKGRSLYKIQEISDNKELQGKKENKGLNVTMYIMVKRNNDTCERYRIKENVNV